MAEYIDLDTPLELYVEHGGFYKKQTADWFCADGEKREES